MDESEELKFGEVTISLPRKDIKKIWGKAKRMVDIFLEDEQINLKMDIPTVEKPRIVKLSDQTLTQIRSLSGDGKTHKEIAKLLKISESSVYKYLKRLLDEDKDYKPMLNIDTRVPKEDYAKVGD